MPPRRETLEEMGRTRLIAEREATRDVRWDHLRTLAWCLLWLVIGAVMVGMAFHTTDRKAGWIWFWSGIIVHNTGFTVTIAGWYRRGVERGDW